MLKLLIGYDGSEPADAAIRDLARAGLPRDVEATVLSVADLPTEVPFLNYGSDHSSVKNLPTVVVLAARENAARVVSEAQQYAQKGAELVRSLWPSWNVKHESLVDSPAWAIVRRAQESSVDLIVVGSQGRSGLGRLALGSVSQNVLQHAHCSVRVGRIDVTAPSTTTAVNLLLGVDGSHHSAVAVSAIAARPWPAGTQVKVIAALDRRFWTAIAAGALATEWIGEGATDEQSWARHAVDEVARELTAVGLVATADVVEGDPKRVLVDEAKRSATDCIFVGAKGHTRIERLLLGSVSAAVAANAPCSVEIVRHG
jgi:nucleotide-binding universal stress UspA family protein